MNVIRLRVWDVIEYEDEYHGLSVRTHLLNATVGGCHA